MDLEEIHTKIIAKCTQEGECLIFPSVRKKFTVSHNGKTIIVNPFMWRFYNPDNELCEEVNKEKLCGNHYCIAKDHMILPTQTKLAYLIHKVEHNARKVNECLVASQRTITYQKKTTLVAKLIHAYYHSSDITDSTVFTSCKTSGCISKDHLINRIGVDANATQRICEICEEDKTVDKFYPNTKLCKICYNKRQKNRINTDVTGFLNNLLSTARGSARSRSNRELAGIFNITIQDLITITKDQNGRCFYSDIPLSFRQNSDYQCSLERLDPSLGYIPTNIKLIASEFQGACQWSTDKYKEFIRLIHIKHEKQIIDWDIKYQRGDIKSFDKRRDIREGKYCFCHYCQTEKSLSEFNSNLCKGCKSCIAINDKKYRATPRGHLAGKKSTMKLRHQKKCFGNFTLTTSDLIEIIESQNGLCYYSGIPLHYGSHYDKWWTASAERKDINSGYTKENTCFVCYEFNTADNTNKAINKDDVTGNTAWSLDKIEYIKSLDRMSKSSTYHQDDVTLSKQGVGDFDHMSQRLDDLHLDK